MTTFQNNLAVIKQQIVKKYFHQSWNINCPILFNTISFYTEMISISLFLGLHIELNILGTRDISCVRHEIQIWNTISNKIIFFDLIIFRTLVLMWKSSGRWPPGSPTRWNCVTSTFQGLSSSTFKVCLSVRDRWSTILTQYHQELTGTALYWLSTLRINHCCPILHQFAASSPRSEEFYVEYCKRRQTVCALYKLLSKI